MSLFELLAAAGVVGLALAMPVIARPRPARSAWWVPAGLGAAFAAWSAYAVVADGPLGFWDVHTDSAWGVQVWLDLLLAFGVGWFLVQPRLRTAGIAPMPWLVAILLTGSVGVLAMLALLLWAERRAGLAGAESRRSHLGSGSPNR